MNLRQLKAAVCSMVFFVVAHSQTSDGFPPLRPVPRTGHLTDNPQQTEFTFIAAGDNRPNGGKVTQPPIFAQILNDAKQFNPVFMLWAGDTIGGFRIVGKKMDRTHLMNQYKEFFRIASTAGVPIFNSPGNHEMDRVDKNGKETIETPDSEMQQLYLEMMEYPKDAPPYGAFDYGNSRFIAVDTEEVPTQLVVRSPGKVVGKNLKLDPGFVSSKQIELLKADLEANKHKAHIFVFMHHPIKPAKAGSRLNKENADELEKLFAKYHNVSYVIAAHEHIYFNASGHTRNPPKRKDPSKDGPGYLVTGGAGAPLDKCPSKSSKNCLAANHYIVFTVKGDDVEVKVVTVK